MKHILIAFLLLLVAESGVACSCGPIVLNEAYASADVVMHARVRKAFPNEPQENPYYKIEIEPIKTFKGLPVKELFVYGSMDNISRSSCDFYVQEGSEWIIYASMRNGLLQFGMCDGSQVTRDVKGISESINYQKFVQRKLKVLNFLHRKVPKLKYSDPIPLMFFANLSNFLKSYQGTEFKKPFGQYLIVFNSELEVESVKVLTGLTRKFDSQLITKLKDKNSWYPFPKSVKREKHTILVGIYCLENPGGGVALSQFGP